MRIGVYGALAALAAWTLAGCWVALAQPEPTDPWPELRSQIFADRPTEDGSAVLALDAPPRAEDAAIVPLTIRLLPSAQEGREVRRITLVIDQNPSPLAAVIELGPASGVDRVATRVRVDILHKHPCGR